MGTYPCANPESFVRVFIDFSFLVDDGKEDPNITIGLPAKCHFNGISLVGR